ncbi:MAG: hypothetical protein K8M05_26455 [Deltaproteobacteria bacterium]|nr:hypothetical protein [Kofleriaceae bacterium]
MTDRRACPGDVFEVCFAGPAMAALGADLRRTAPCGREVERTPSSLTATFPLLCLRADYLLELVAMLPFEIAVVSSSGPWADDYLPPSIGLDAAAPGWGLVLKGGGHDRWIASRRWLEYGPYRVVYGPYDTTLVQFHDGSAKLEQARPGHAWITTGLLRPRHGYQQTIRGEYDARDGVLRVHVRDRDVTQRELVDAAAARRDRHADPERPVRNIAYVFGDDARARACLDTLWLLELECHALVDGALRRLDQTYFRRLAQPAWVQQLALAR